MDDTDLYNEIAMVALELYEKSGRVEGRDLDNWLEAEQIARTRYGPKEKNKGEVFESRNMEYAGDEKRRNERFTITEIQREFLHSSNIRIIDISVGGAAIEATKKLEINKEYRLHINHKGTPIKLEGRVVWSILAREEKKESGDIIAIYKGGMKFHRSFLINPLL